MFIVHVFVHVKEEYIQAFQHATLENARNSVQEPGIARFDFLQQEDDPTRFLLIEVYRTNRILRAIRKPLITQSGAIP